MFWIIILLIVIFYYLRKSTSNKTKGEAHKETDKPSEEKAEHYLRLDKWRVEDGAYVSEGEVIASISFVTQLGKLKMVDRARNLRAEASGYLKHQAQEGRLDISLEYPEDPKRVSFNRQDIALIENTKI